MDNISLQGIFVLISSFSIQNSENYYIDIFSAQHQLFIFVNTYDLLKFFRNVLCPWLLSTSISLIHQSPDCHLQPFSSESHNDILVMVQMYAIRLANNSDKYDEYCVNIV